MKRSREMRPDSILKIRDELVKKFRFLVRTRAESIGMPIGEFQDWIDGFVGEGIAVALNHDGEWDEERGDLLYWAFMKTRYLIRKDFARMKRQMRTDHAFGELQDDRQQTRNNDPSRQLLIRQQLVAIFEDITDKQGEALILHHLLGYSVKDIHRLTGQPKKTLYTLIRRGLKGARKRHSPEWRRQPQPKTEPTNQDKNEDIA
jgi:RNA polymerase sigma factor (sigma-70 family)